MLNFPIPYQDELIYSVVARAGVRLGEVSPKQLLDEVFGSRTVVATLDLPSHIADVAKWLPRECTVEQLTYHHTLFPLYAPFVPEAQRQRCLDWMARQSRGAVHLTLGVAASRVKTPRLVRYCPACLKEQRLNAGEFYWNRKWQIAGLDACSAHGSLIESELLRTPAERHRFLAASPECCPDTQQTPADLPSIWVGRQVDDLLNLDVLQSPSFAQWTRYYQTLVDRHGLRRGAKQVDHRLVRDLVLKTWPAAWLENHHLLPDASSKDGADWLHGIFRKHRKSFGYLEHIVVNQALLGDHWHIKDAISEALQYPAKSKRKVVSIELQSNPEVTPDQQAWMMLLEELPPKRARETSPALYSRLYRKNRLWLLSENRRHAAKNVGGGARKVDWDQRDRECFDRLKRVSASLKAKNSGRRRTPAAYLQEMENKATVEKNLFRMPLSKSYLTSEAESVAAFQIRRLKCAYRNLESEVAQPPRWRLLRTANLSDERLTAEADKFLTSLLEDQNELQGR